MQFAFTDEQAMIADTARAFFVEQATSERTRAAMASGEGIDRALWRAFTQELGLGGVALPESFGGAGLGLVEYASISEAAGRQVAALPLLSSLGLAAQAILAGGSDEQRSQWLGPLLSGDTIASFAGTGHCGDRAPEFQQHSGRLSGIFDHVPHGAIADLFVVAVEGQALLIERGKPGVSVIPLTTMDQTRPLARLVLDDVEADRLDNGEQALHRALLSGWIAIAADALGGAEACLERTVAYARERVQFRRPIGSFQAVKHRLADMMVLVEQARSAVYWAACAADEGTDDALLAAHSAKAFATDAYFECAGAMIQLHGGIGFTWEHDAHLFFKRARANQTLLGSPAWHREQVARLIGLGEAA